MPRPPPAQRVPPPLADRHRGLDENLRLARLLDLDEALVVHLYPADLTAQPGHHSLRLLGSERIFKAVKTNPQSVKTLLAASDSDDWTPDVGLGDPPVSLHHDHLPPDVILYCVPLAVYLVDMILQREGRDLSLAFEYLTWKSLLLLYQISSSW